jgi:regulatory protein
MKIKKNILAKSDFKNQIFLFLLPCRIKNFFPFQEIKQKIVNYCVYQDRCHAEVEQKMREFLLIPEAKEEILLYLIKENYLNEERFTRSYVRGNFI